MEHDKHTRMMKKLEKITSTTKRIWIGLDVHKKTYAVAVYGRGRILARWSMPSDIFALIRILLRFREQIGRIAYEAGPTGFHLARELEKAGLPVGIAAPSRMKKAQDETKTDEVDAKTLAEHAAKDWLTYIAIPTEEEEEDRQVVRLAEQMKKKYWRVKEQIRSFLLMHDIRLDEDKGRWTCAFVAALERVSLSPGLRFVLDSYLKELKFLKGSLKEIEADLKRIDEKHRASMDILLSHPGVGDVIARLFTHELFRPERFGNRKCVARMLGLAPGLHESGTKKKTRGVLAAGLGRLRSALIQGTWVWINRSKEARTKYRQLCCRTGSAQKAVVAMARRLAGHLWSMLVHGCLYDASLATQA